jgi:hypothetical protein
MLSNAERTASGQNESFQLSQSPNMVAMWWRASFSVFTLKASPSVAPF